MSYITFDYRCSACGVTEQRMVKREVMDQQPCENVNCDLRRVWPHKMVRLPAGPRTTFRFADRKLK